MTARVVVLELAQLEAAHLTDLVEQFTALLHGEPDDPLTDDPAVARLVPDAYRDDPDAAREFRALTQADLLERRVADADVVLTTLLYDGVRLVPAQMDAASAHDAMTVALDNEQTAAWLRTLASLRLVLATRLGISDDDDHDADDPRFGVYDWVGYRLEGLLQALEA